MKFQLYKYYGNDEGIHEKDLQLFRIGDHWLFDFNFYKGRFKSYGLDVHFNPMYPLNDLFSVRIHWCHHSVSFGFVQRDFCFDEWDDLIDLDTEIKL
jgi:2-hydroxychromene-2-carboxylate isomerase